MSDTDSITISQAVMCSLLQSSQNRAACSDHDMLITRHNHTARPWTAHMQTPTPDNLVLAYHGDS